MDSYECHSISVTGLGGQRQEREGFKDFPKQFLFETQIHQQYSNNKIKLTKNKRKVLKYQTLIGASSLVNFTTAAVSSVTSKLTRITAKTCLYLYQSIKQFCT